MISDPINGNGVSPANGTTATSNAHPKKNTPGKNIHELDGDLKNVNADWRIHGSMTGALDAKGLSSLYDGFADDYENAYNHVGYEGPRNVAAALKENLSSKLTSSTARVFDAGCGTGMIGIALAALGFKEIHGVDFSAGMLKKCADKGLYSSLTEANLMEPLQFDTDSFDAVVSCGVFTSGHVKKTALLELIRITRPGGIMSIGTQELVYEAEGYPTFIADLEKKKVIRKIGLKTTWTMSKAKTGMTIMLLEVL